MLSGIVYYFRRTAEPLTWRLGCFLFGNDRFGPPLHSSLAYPDSHVFIFSQNFQFPKKTL
jgi:hypothetical protein